MDLSSNVCSLCCSVESKRLLQLLVRKDDACQEEFVREFLGPCQVSGALACGRCREMIGTCQDFRTSCRRNLEKVRMIQEEGRGCQVPDSTSVIVKIEREGVEFPDNSGLPDSRRSSAGTIDSEEKRDTQSMDEEDLVGEKTEERQSLDVDNIKSEDVKSDDNRAKKREKAVQWRKSLYQVNSPSEAIRLNNYREANRVRNVRYRERKRTESTGSGESWRGEHNDDKSWRGGDNNDDNKYWRGADNNDDNKYSHGSDNNDDSKSFRSGANNDDNKYFRNGDNDDDNKLWRAAENEDNTRWRERKRTMSDDNLEFWQSERNRKESVGSIESWQSARNRTESNGSIESWRADDDNNAPININVTPDVSLVVEEGYRAYQEKHTSTLASPHIKPSPVLQRISSHPSKVIVPTSSSNLVLPAPFPASSTPMPIMLRGVSGGGAGPDVLYLTPLTTPQSPIQATPTGGLATPTSDPEERRRARNREASRRYREKARGDPGLLLKMREQQNKRQKKYYARLREKKYYNEASGSYEAKDTSFPFPPHMDWSAKEGGVDITPVDKEETMEQEGMALDHHTPSISLIKHEFKTIDNTTKKKINVMIV